eukprot:CAMPEP_0172737280 /NCGR_PEP_ID=MMETSP1074-20121228/117334_1 /TAXON_ID=2916 /ORGANISM="Ceratium fusus, Strain PA161109" /LENGTH=44 /DNA_ID= /DNA_START= /DNA_END= /DNA_ORIENTATION=
MAAKTLAQGLQVRQIWPVAFRAACIGLCYLAQSFCLVLACAKTT